MTATDTRQRQAASDRPATRTRGLRRYLAMPAFIVVVLVALFAFVAPRELDQIEAVRLTPEFLSAAFMRHLYLVSVSTVLVILISVPLGVFFTRTFMRRVSPGIVAVASTAQAIPSIGVVVLLALFFDLGPNIAIAALVVYAFVPVLRNTMVGLQQVDASVIEAGRGMGMSKRAVLFKMELPLSIPVMLAGVRTALVINVGTAAIATLINAGGLGDVIYTGLVQNRPVVTLVGAVLTGVTALLIDYLAGIAEEHLRPKGL